MLKKFFIILLVVILVLGIVIPIKKVYAKEKFFEAKKEELTLDDNIELIINLNKIEYSKIKIEIISDAIINEFNVDEEIETEQEENELFMEVDKENIGFEKITIELAIPEDKNVGDTLTFAANVTNLENEEETQTEILNVTIVEKNNKGSQSEEKTTNSNKTTNSSKSTSSTKSQTSTSNKSTSTTENVTYNGSSNNYLSSLEVEGYSLNKEFYKDNNIYFVIVNDSVSAINIITEAEENTATVSVYGTENLKNGTNKILINVTAENGNVRTYKVYVTVKTLQNTDNSNKILQTNSEVISGLSENIELHATYYLSECYVEKNQEVKKGENILKYTNGTFLTAPYDCIVTELNIPSSNEKCTNEHYVSVSSVNVLSVQFKVDETKINSFFVGQSAKITITAIDGAEVEGYVTKISSIANNGKFTVTVGFENSFDAKIGMTASVEI